MGWFDENAPRDPAGNYLSGVAVPGLTPIDRTQPAEGNRGSGEPAVQPYSGSQGNLPIPYSPYQHDWTWWMYDNNGNLLPEYQNGGIFGQSQSPAGGNIQQQVQQLLAGVGGTASPQALASIEPQLKALGVSLQKDSAGTIRGRLYLPSGQAVDVVNANGWGQPWTWVDRGASGAGGASGSASSAAYGGLPPGYEMGTYTGGGKYPLASVMGPGLMQPWTTAFTAPDDVTQQNDPGWQFRLQEGAKAIERSAAAKGTLLSGKTLKDLTRWGQEYASGEYDKVYGRALGEYQQAYNIFNNNANNQYSRMAGFAGLEQNANIARASANTAYANNAADLITSQGGVNASGQVGSANAWSNLPQDLYNYGSGLYLSSILNQQSKPLSTNSAYNVNTPINTPNVGPVQIPGTYGSQFGYAIPKAIWERP